MKYISQRFNGRQKSYLKIDCDDATANALIALMPNGQEVLEESATPASGTARAVPTSYFSFSATCYDSVDGKNDVTFVNCKYGKPTLTNITARTALIGVIETPNLTACDKVGLRSMKRVGA